MSLVGYDLALSNGKFRRQTGRCSTFGPFGLWERVGRGGNIGPMASVHDVAAAILERQGQMSAMKLQKLVYYCQAWHLVWDEEPLFPDRIEAWANGPVVPALYREHRGQFSVATWSRGDSSRLTHAQIETIEAVLEGYGDRPGQWLSDLTHQERPWREARQGLAPGERGSREITKAAMAEYYGSLYEETGD
jgi:uncharacterized phage-associated protein